MRGTHLLDARVERGAKRLAIVGITIQRHSYDGSGDVVTARELGDACD